MSSVIDDVGDLYEDINAEDELGVVLKGAIYIENQLDRLIEEVSCSPTGLKRLNLDYSGKINLALVMGLDERFRPPLSTIGSIRNRFAHQLKSQVSQGDVDNIYNCLAHEDRIVVQSTYMKTRIKAGHERPASIKGLDPLDQFRLYTVALRAALVVARHQAASASSPPSSKT